MSISIIVARSENNVIGNDNKLIWKLSSDLNMFKELTTDSNIIMGRKTYDSIGRILPNRLNIVVTRNDNIKIKGALITNSIEEALNKCSNNKNTFIIGGSQIYKQSIKYVDSIYLTEVDTCIKGDSKFFSDKDILDMGFKEVSRKRFESDSKNEYNYTFVKYEL